jgi:hypothetical protein
MIKDNANQNCPVGAKQFFTQCYTKDTRRSLLEHKHIPMITMATAISRFKVEINPSYFVNIFTSHSISFNKTHAKNISPNIANLIAYLHHL